MAKTLQELFGKSATYLDGKITLDYQEMAVLSGVDPDLLLNNPTPEGIAGQILFTLNKTTRLALDDRGFPVSDNTQGIVSSNVEPRRTFVIRDEDDQVKMVLLFDVYIKDVNSFLPKRVIN